MQLTTLRSGLTVFACVAMAGCAALPAVGLNLAAQGAQGLIALTLGPLVDMQDRSEPDRCVRSADKGISVTESFEAAIPTGEGNVEEYEPAYWRPEFAREGYPQVERSRTPTEGTLAITDRALLFIPPPGATSVRIPFELVNGVDIDRMATTGVPQSVIVKSCNGRYDIVTVGSRTPNDPDREASAVAAQLNARVAAFRAAADGRAPAPR